MTRSALIVGGGLMGTTTAWFLAERGYEVTVVERREAVGLETSYANGGLVTPSQSDPWNAPGTFGLMLRYLGREDAPLLLRPRALPGLWRWGLGFLAASRPRPWRGAAKANLRLGLYSLAQLDALREGLGIEYDALRRGTLKLFRDAAPMRESVALAVSLAPLGLRHRVLDPGEAAALEPLLEPLRGELAGAIHYPDDECGDAHAFTQGLARHARAAGVRFQFGTEVRKLEARGEGITAAHTVAGPLTADVYVLAAASESPRLAAQVGFKLPIYPVKGYSVTLSAAAGSRSLGLPLVDFEQKVVITPLGTRLRIAGTAEFNGYDSELNPERGAHLLAQALALVPELGRELEHVPVQHWAGLRPMTSDGPPILGATPYRNLYCNTGHGPLGWTLAAGSSRLVADLIAGRATEIGLMGLDLKRFTS